jgi:ABC-type branched-subunit amino acid transport system permease subunit
MNKTFQPSIRAATWLWLLLCAAFLAYLPTLLTERAFLGMPLSNTQLLNLGLTQVNLMLISMLGALSLNYLTGCAGLISIGHAAFFATGAMAAAVFDTQLGWPFPVVLLAAALAGALAIGLRIWGGVAGDTALARIPDSGPAALDAAIAWYRERERRFGRTSEQVQEAGA